MLYSFTASHYDYENKYLLLDYMINSCISNTVKKCYISISFNNYFDWLKYKKYIYILEKKYYNKIGFFIHYKKLFQFQHILFLSQNINLKSKDRILFIDDDDLLLSIPPEYDIVPGIQYLSNITETDFTNFYIQHEIISLLKTTKLQIVNDFSGYICTVDILKQFFKINNFNFNFENKTQKFLLNLIDCKFMNYIDSINTSLIKPSPFIFHRIWSVPERKIQTWRL